MTKKCDRCGSNRILNVFAHSKDMGSIEVEHLGIDHRGYFPEIPNICDGDDAYFNVCLDCGKIQGDFPIEDEVVIAATAEDDD